MTNAVFTTSESSAYDDRIEAWYQFPQTYLKKAQQALGDLVVYYEPRRNSGPSSSTGRQAYFAVAQVSQIEADSNLPNHFFAYLKNFLEFDKAVPFRDTNGNYFESSLQKEDGSTNKGSFGRSVRLIPNEEFELILRTGLSTQPEKWELRNGVAEEIAEYVVRPVIEQVISRKFRDVAFRRHVRAAYQNTCAVSGLCLLNGGGRPEVQAAHIRPVEADGPDTVRNGLALTSTVHWLFDRGLVSFDDNYNILLSPHGIPHDLERLMPANRKLTLPNHPEWRPHSTYLKWHRENRFKV